LEKKEKKKGRMHQRTYQRNEIMHNKIMRKEENYNKLE
jgi:hypothetical protein